MAITKVITPDLIDLKNSQLASGVATTYAVTVVAVAGVGNRYFVDGVQTPNIVLIPGTQYIITQDDVSNASHPILLSTSIANTGVYSTGVVYSLNGADVSYSSYISGFAAATQRKITITLSSPPATLYYVCYYHQNMGNTVITVGGALNTDGIVLAKGPTGATAPVQYLVVAGGGGGGTGFDGSGAGGGGGGGLITTTGDFSTGSPLSLIIGLGGAGAASVTASTGNNGGNSQLDTIIAAGGGGASGAYVVSNKGGSGGGGWGFNTAPSNVGATGTGSQGNSGGDGFDNGSQFSGGGGGGFTSAGGSGSSTAATQIGGAGIEYAASEYGIILRASAGGGGGAANNQTPGAGGLAGSTNIGGAGATSNNSGVNERPGEPAVSGTGSGGGGGSRDGGSNTNAAGGNGSAGFIALKMPSGTTAAFSAGVTFTFDNTSISGQNIYRITATTNSTQTVTFSSTVPSTGRPTTNLIDGEFRYNTTTKKVEFYDGAKWFALISSPALPQAGTTGTCNYPTTATALYQLNSGVGSNVPDTCGTYDGTATSITYSAGNFGNAANFNGSSSGIVLPSSLNTNVIDATGAFSISMWINTNSLSAIQYLFCASVSNNIDVSINGNNQGVGKIIWTIYNGSYSYLTSTTTITTNDWYHIVATYNNGSRELFINSASQGTSTKTLVESSTEPTLGYRTGSGSSERFDGEMDQLRIFPSALTQEQVSALYTETTP